jgi:hypothetical protein
MRGEGISFVANKTIMKRILLLSFAVALAFICSSVAQAGHPLIQNGWLKSATDTSITIKLPPRGEEETTFEFAPNVKISFNGADGTPEDLQAFAESMGKARILVNLRRQNSESTTVVLIVIKADKPDSPTQSPQESTATAPSSANPAE